MNESIFFSGWSGIIRIVIVGVLAYAALVLVLRILGNRTLSRMHAFDLVVTVAPGDLPRLAQQPATDAEPR